MVYMYMIKEEKSKSIIEPKKVHLEPTSNVDKVSNVAIDVSKDSVDKENMNPNNLIGILSLRAEYSKNRPAFVRPESWRYAKLKPTWRRPKGKDHKVRKMVKGWPVRVKVGYGGPNIAKGLHPSGLRDILVHTVSEIERLNPRTDAIRFSSTLGVRKRMDILVRANKLGLKVLNPCISNAKENKD